MPLIPFLESPSLPESAAAGGSQGQMRTTGGRLGVHNGAAWKQYAFTDEVVDLSTAQSIAGIKTFTAAPVVPDSSFGVAKIAASGTKDGTTFLSGDGTWKVPAVSTPANMVTTDTTQTISGAKTFSSNVSVGANLTLANPGVGAETSIVFTKSSDSAGIKVTETVADQTHYAFYMADNPDANDAFAWKWDDWSNPGSGWTPLYMTAINTTVTAKALTINGDVTIGNKGFVTSLGGSHGNRDFLRTTTPAKTGTGTVTLTVDATGYTGTTGQSFWVKIEAGGTTFQWGYGSNHTSPVTQQTALPLSTSATTLSNGIKVTFSATTGAVAGDVWTMRAFQGGTLSVPNLIVTTDVLAPRGTAANVGYGFSANGDTGMWSAGVNMLNFSVGGTNRIALTTTAESHTLPTTFSSTLLSTTGVYDGATAVAANRVYSVNNKVPVAGLSVTGTASASTYLRGDGTWATLPAETLAATIIDAKGDLIVGTAADVAARQAVGANNTVLIADSAQTNGLKWDTLPLASLSATGTASATTFLRGDNTWAAPTVTAANVTDATATGRSVMTATDAAAARTAIGAGTSSFSGAYSALSGIPTTFAPSAHAASHGSGGSDAVTIALSQISATGTRDDTTFLSGDGTWKAPVAAAPSNMVTTDTTQTISGDKTFSGSVTVPDASFTVSKISATGTRDATTYLRGDGTWATVAVGSGDVTTNTAQTITGVKTFTAAPQLGDAASETDHDVTIGARAAIVGITGGTYFTHNANYVASTWQSKAAAGSSIFGLEGDAITFYSNLPTAAGQTINPTKVFAITSTGMVDANQIRVGSFTGGADSFRIDGTSSSPYAANLLFGDGTGWHIRFLNANGTNAHTELGDRGDFSTRQVEVSGSTVAGTSYAAGASTVAGGGAGTYHGAVLVQPGTFSNAQVGVLVRAPSSAWGTGVGYAEGQYFLAINENNDVRFRVDRNGGVGFTGALHVSPGANGAPTAGVTQAAWIQPLAAMTGLVVDLNSGNTSSDIALFRSSGGTSNQLRIKGNYGVEVGDRTTIYGASNAANIMHNAYFDGTNWRFLKAGPAQLIQLGDAYQAQYMSSASGAAGGVITWVGVMASHTSNFTIPQGRNKFTNQGTAPDSIGVAAGEFEMIAFGSRPYVKSSGDVAVAVDSVRSYTLASNVAATGTAQTTVLSSGTMPAGTYAFEIIGAAQGSTTGQGLRVAVAAPTSTFFIQNLMHATGNTSFAATTGISNGSLIGTATTTLTSGLPFQVWGYATTTAAGQFIFRAASSTTGSQTILTGTLMRITRIA